MGFAAHRATNMNSGVDVGDNIKISENLVSHLAAIEKQKPRVLEWWQINEMIGTNWWNDLKHNIFEFE